MKALIDKTETNAFLIEDDVHWLAGFDAIKALPQREALFKKFVNNKVMTAATKDAVMTKYLQVVNNINGKDVLQGQETNLTYLTWLVVNALCHYSYLSLDRAGVLLDIQGVYTCFTDIQVVTGEAEFSLGNTGAPTVNQFAKEHRCNIFCRMCELSPLEAAGTRGK